MRCSKCKDKRLSFVDFVKIQRYNAKEKNGEKRPYICSNCGQEFYKEELRTIIYFGIAAIYTISVILCLKKFAYWLQDMFRFYGVDTSFKTNPLGVISVTTISWCLTMFIVGVGYVFLMLIISWRFEIKIKHNETD